MPLIGFGFANLFGVDGPALTVVIIVFSVPCASNSYLLARLMGGDAKLMAEIITLQTLVATITLPLACCSSDDPGTCRSFCPDDQTFSPCSGGKPCGQRA